MIKKLKKIQYETVIFADILNGLVKAFGYVSHELLLAKLDEYENQITKVGSYFNTSVYTISVLSQFETAKKQFSNLN